MCSRSRLHLPALHPGRGDAALGKVVAGQRHLQLAQVLAGQVSWARGHDLQRGDAAAVPIDEPADGVEAVLGRGQRRWPVADACRVSAPWRTSGARRSARRTPWRMRTAVCAVTSSAGGKVRLPSPVMPAVRRCEAGSAGPDRIKRPCSLARSRRAAGR